jgi:glycosyltransferase involved in cell wall biosynthesis
MKIAINCWVLRNKQLDGIGYFTINAVARMIRQHPDIQFQILCDKNFTEDYFQFPNVTQYRVFPPYRHPVLYLLFMETVVPFFLNRHKPDVFLSMEGFLSLFSRCKQVPLIHDINFEHKPEDLKWQNRLYFRFFFKRFARKATRIATISEYSKMDIARFYHVPSAKIDNVSGGIRDNFRPLSPAEIQDVRIQWSSGKPYFFFVGSMHPRKNIKRLLEAFSLFKEKTGSDIKLVLAGSILWKTADLKDAYESSSCKEDIIFTGRLSDDDLRKVLGAALALSFVPIFEGFGLPIVEAMQSDVPVICSNVSSMPEVAGDAALLVDPYDLNSISMAMEKIFSDAGLRALLIQRGNLQKEKFSWDRTALLLWQTLQRAVRGGD